MALAQRTDAVHPPIPAAPPPEDRAASPWGEATGDHGYRPGGQVGQMQADLAHRLACGLAASAAAPSPAERVVRFLSVAGGYAALLAGYVGIALLILR